MDPALLFMMWLFLSKGSGPSTTREYRKRIKEMEKDLPRVEPKKRRRRRRRRRAPPPPAKTKTTTITTRRRGGKKTTTVRTTTRARRKSNLERRAIQKRARDWTRDLQKAGASPKLARALSRWIGMESSGEPLARSRIGERGLLQATKTTALREKLFTPAEWAKLRSPASSRAFHAAMVLKQYKFHRRRARRWVGNKPPLSSLDWVYYAKMHHTRPRDLQEYKTHGPALKMHKDMWVRPGWTKRKRQRLAMAAVARFGKVYP